MATAARAQDAAENVGLETELPSNSFGSVRRRNGLSMFDSTNGSQKEGTRDDQATARPTARRNFHTSWASDEHVAGWRQPSEPNRCLANRVERVCSFRRIDRGLVLATTAVFLFYPVMRVDKGAFPGSSELT